MVIIKGFEMPKSCEDCPICYDTIECPVGPGLFDSRILSEKVKQFYAENPNWFIERRHIDCPLLEWPSANVQHIRHGRWIKNYNAVNPYDVYMCSICKKAIYFPFSYCPKCGARMDGEKR